MILDPRKFESHLRVLPQVPPLFADLPYQPNGIDLRLWDVNHFTGIARFNFSVGTEERIVRGGISRVTARNPYRLREGAYEFLSTIEIVKPLPEDVTALIIGRSTFTRLGVLIRSGLYDSGYSGPVGGCLFLSRAIEVQQFFRIAQIVFMSAESIKLYNGQYKEEYETDLEAGGKMKVTAAISSKDVQSEAVVASVQEGAEKEMFGLSEEDLIFDEQSELGFSNLVDIKDDGGPSKTTKAPTESISPGLTRKSPEKTPAKRSSDTAKGTTKRPSAVKKPSTTKRSSPPAKGAKTGAKK